MNFKYADHFERRPELCGGALVVKGTRVPVRTLLASLAEGATDHELPADFPTVTPTGLRAVIAFAAASAGDDFLVPPVPAVAGMNLTPGSSLARRTVFEYPFSHGHA